MKEHIEWQQLYELLKELAQKEYGDKYGEDIYWFFEDIIDNECKCEKLEEETKKLNNIINELEKFICDLEIECNIDSSMWGVAVIIHNKLKELKGSGSND